MNDFPICVVVYLTNCCYLKCKHCFLRQLNKLNSDTLDFEVISRTLKELKENNVYMIAFTGGDPLLHPKIFDILKLTSDLGMLPLLGISGIGINSEISKKIYDSGVRCVQIGLNGSDSKKNDIYRGKNSFDEVTNSISLLQSQNINVNLSFCLDKTNYKDLENMLDFAKNKKIYKIKIEFWESLSNSKDMELSNDEKATIYDICMSYMIKNNLVDWIQCPKGKTHLNRIRKKAFVIMPNGDVRSTEIGPLYGNINEKPITKIIMQRSNKNGK